MWVSRYNKWHKDVLPLEKFLTERLIQRCDYNEVISNKHRTTNGYTQLKELIQLGELSFKRSRTVKTLMTLLEEATSKRVKQNIIHDVIINKYFIALQDYIATYRKEILLNDRNQPNLTELGRFLHQLKIFEVQLDDHYFEVLKREFIAFNYEGESKFLARAEDLSELIDLLIPYLVFKGYSIASISEVLITWLKNGYRPTVKRIFDFFHFQKRDFHFMQYLGKKNAEFEAFIPLMQDSLQVELKEITADDLGADFVNDKNLDGTDVLVAYKVKVLDPHNNVRYQYDELLKKVVMQKERQSLTIFNNFFTHSFWSHSSTSNVRKLKEIALDGDPINVHSRGKTLRNTLHKCAPLFRFNFNEDADLPIVDNKTLKNSIYYYNLALGSKSIENSLSLLWTALETIIPYRTSGSDIECIQNIVCKGLGIGAVARDVNSFAIRLIQQSQQNNNMLSELGTRGFDSYYTPNGLTQWFDWIADVKNGKKRFSQVKQCSELLAFQYSSLGIRYAKEPLQYFINRIESSKASTKYQLQRIYLHRNQIVHAGDLVSEYSNLWMHLEWYVGKLLAYFIINIHYLNKFGALDTAYRELEADHDYLMAYLSMNNSIAIANMSSRVKSILMEHSWQSF